MGMPTNLGPCIFADLGTIGPDIGIPPLCLASPDIMTCLMCACVGVQLCGCRAPAVLFDICPGGTSWRSWTGWGGATTREELSSGDGLLVMEPVGVVVRVALSSGDGLVLLEPVGVVVRAALNNRDGLVVLEQVGGVILKASPLISF